MVSAVSSSADSGVLWVPSQYGGVFVRLHMQRETFALTEIRSGTGPGWPWIFLWDPSQKG